MYLIPGLDSHALPSAEVVVLSTYDVEAGLSVLSILSVSVQGG